MFLFLLASSCYKDYLSADFPFNSYKQVFIEPEMAVSSMSLGASMNIFSSQVLFDEKLIDQVSLLLYFFYSFFFNQILLREWWTVFPFTREFPAWSLAVLHAYWSALVFVLTDHWYKDKTCICSCKTMVWCIYHSRGTSDGNLVLTKYCPIACSVFDSLSIL